MGPAQDEVFLHMPYIASKYDFVGSERKFSVAYLNIKDTYPPEANTNFSLIESHML